MAPPLPSVRVTALDLALATDRHERRAFTCPLVLRLRLGRGVGFRNSLREQHSGWCASDGRRLSCCHSTRTREPQDLSGGLADPDAALSENRAARLRQLVYRGQFTLALEPTLHGIAVSRPAREDA